MSGSIKVRAAVGAALFAGFALLSVGCSMKSPVAPATPPPVETQIPQ